MFGITKRTTEIYTKIWRKKQFVIIFFQLKGALAYQYCRFRPPHLSQAHRASRSLMKDNRLKLRLTGSRVLLVKVSDSGPVSKFSTFFRRFWYKFNFNYLWKSWKLIFFHNRIFFQDLKKNSEFFIQNYFRKSWKFNFFIGKTYFFPILTFEKIKLKECGNFWGGGGCISLTRTDHYIWIIWKTKANFKYFLFIFR